LTWQHLGAVLTGVAIGFLGGLFGKGGSAVATPLLSLLGFPGFVAVASPLPAAIPSTLIASAEYWRSQLLDWEVVWWSIGIGTPAIVAGSLLSPYVGAKPLLVVTGLLVLAFGISFLFFPKDRSLVTEAANQPTGVAPVLLASAACRGRDWRRLGLWTAGQRRWVFFSFPATPSSSSSP
jgi:uncharacterized membrane protein YfcA